jgi:hypothetical protein
MNNSSVGKCHPTDCGERFRFFFWIRVRHEQPRGSGHSIDPCSFTAGRNRDLNGVGDKSVRTSISRNVSFRPKPGRSMNFICSTKSASKARLTILT